VKLVYTTAAVDDLERLRGVVREQNPQAAQRIVDRLQEAATQLVNYPLIGVATDRSPNIRDLIVDDYLVRYHVAHEHRLIVILRIWHAKENLR
jgi:addiction module RelE/StbE family toxin